MSIAEDDRLAQRVGELLARRGAKVAVMESTAGGLVSARILSVPGASAWFDRGAVAYGGRSKQDMTGVPIDVLRNAGAVSAEAVSAMAQGLRQLAGVDYAVAESGIAGPQGSRRSPKPVGSVAIAVAGPSRTHAEERVLPGTRVEVMRGIAERCLEALVEMLEAEPGAG